MIKFIFLLFSFSTASYAGLLDVPLRSLTLDSLLQINTEAISAISTPGSVHFQNGGTQPEFNIDQSKAYCSIWTSDSFDPKKEDFTTFTISSIEGAAVVGVFSEHYFKTSINLSASSYRNISFNCIRPLRPQDAIEELSLTDLSLIMGQFLKIKKVTLNPGSFERRDTLPLSAILILENFEVRAKKKLVLKAEFDNPKHLSLDVGSCNFFKSALADEKEFIIPEGTSLKPKYFEILYNKSFMVGLRPHVILRFEESETFGVSCEGNSEYRMFDYQDFWDATESNGPIGWIIKS